MKRVVILGHVGAGKSTLARQIGQFMGLPVIELDKIFWRPRLSPTPAVEWIAIQRSLAAADSWIMDGDLGPSDTLDVRLQRADTVLFLIFPLSVAHGERFGAPGSGMISGFGLQRIGTRDAALSWKQ